MSSGSSWLRRYLIFGTIFAAIHIILILGLFVFGMNFGDGPPTAANQHGAGVIDFFTEILCFPVIGSGSAGVYLLPLNIIAWGLGPVAIWHAFSVILVKTVADNR